MANRVIINNNIFRAYFYKRKSEELPYKMAVLATAHKLYPGNVCYAWP